MDLPRYEPELYGRPMAFSRLRLLAGRAATLSALAAGAGYMSWRLSTLGGTGGLGIAFYAVEALNYASFALAAVLLWRLRWRTGPAAPPRGSLDVFVTVCGEPLEMVEATLRAALAIEHPHRTYVLNDGRLAGKDGWEGVEALARRYGVRCFTRSTGVPGKAGNLNNAIVETDGEFLVLIDADHSARPGLADETLGYFAQGDVGFVCTPQAFAGSPVDLLGNRELLFYRSLQAAKDAAGSAFSCGNGTVYRRRALDSIGGFSEWSLVEDVHTSLELHAAGWESVYHPRAITTGTAPEAAATFARQRLRWATDSLRILFRRNPLWKRGLTLFQRLHYLQTTSFYLVAATQVFFLVAPALYLLWRVPVMSSQPAAYLWHALPHYGALAFFLVVYGGVRGGARVAQQQLFLAPVYFISVLRALFPLRRRPSVTDKGRPRRFSPLLIPQGMAAALCAAGLAAALRSRDETLGIAGVWALVVLWALVAPIALPAVPATAVRALRPVAVGAAALAVAVLLGLPAIRDRTGSEVAFAGLASASAGDAANLLTGERTRLAPPETGVYLGFFNRAVLMSDDAVERWSSRHGVEARIVNWYQQWLSGEPEFQPGWLDMVSGQGAVPMITWEPWAKPRNRVHAPEQGRVRLQLIASGRYDEYVRSWARAAAAYRGPLLIRFMHEMNGWWYPWSIRSNRNSPAAYVAAWRHVHDIFTAEGATNVSWVWAINSFAGLENDDRRLARYYPGDEYVDWVSMTGFNWGDSNNWNAWRSLDDIFLASYRALSRFGKPVMISEFGTVNVGGDAAAWIERSLLRLGTHYPLVKAVIWFDSAYPGGVDFRLRGDAAKALSSAVGSSDYWSPPLRLVPPPGTLPQPRPDSLLASRAP